MPAVYGICTVGRSCRLSPHFVDRGKTRPTQPVSGKAEKGLFPNGNRYIARKKGGHLGYKRRKKREAEEEEGKESHCAIDDSLSPLHSCAARVSTAAARTRPYFRLSTTWGAVMRACNNPPGLFRR